MGRPKKVVGNSLNLSKSTAIPEEEEDNASNGFETEESLMRGKRREKYREKAGVNHKKQEPKFQTGMNDIDIKEVIKGSFNWYRFCENEGSLKKSLIEFVQQLEGDDVFGKTEFDELKEKIKKCDDLGLHYCICARMYLNAKEAGLKNKPTMKHYYKLIMTFLDNTLVADNSYKFENQRLAFLKSRETANKMAKTVMSELDYHMDKVIAGQKKPEDFDLGHHIIETKANDMSIRLISGMIKRSYLNEFKELYSNKDEELRKSYSHLKEKKIRNITEWLMELIIFCKNFKTGKVLKKKEKTVTLKKKKEKKEKIKPVSKKELTMTLSQVNVSNSVDPKEIHGKKEAWVFNKSNGWIYHFVADKALELINNRIKSFNKDKSKGYVLKNADFNQVLKVIATENKPELKIENMPFNKLILRNGLNEDTSVIRVI